jgi:hypothetical protein
MVSDLTRDLHLGLALVFLFAIALHVVLALWTIARRRGRDAQVFATANALLAASLVIQAVEFGVAIDRFHFDPAAKRAFLGAQLMANLLVLATFFQMLATFERRYRRARGGVRAWITHQLHAHGRTMIPAAYVVVIVGGLAYVLDAGGVADVSASLRSRIGPTSAYLFGAFLWILCFVMFPARRGQEHLAIPVAGRALLLTSLGVTLGLIALWHDARPRVTTEILLPVLHLHSVPVVVFLALVRYEFPFMDRFVLGGTRVVAWLAVVLAAYWTFHRVALLWPDLGGLGLSVFRISILMGAVALAPWFARSVSSTAERLLFARRTDAAGLRDRFAARMAEGLGLASLIEATCADVAEALRARGVRVAVGHASEGHEPVQMRVPLEVAGETQGTLLLGDRRDLLPYFDGERKLLDSIAPLLAGAIAAFRRTERPIAAAGGERALASETPAAPAASPTRGREARPQAANRPRRNWPDPSETLSSRWQSEVLAAAARVGERDPDAGTRVLRTLDRAASHVRADASRQVALESEMAFGRDLLALERLRRGNRMDAAVHFPSSLADQAVPRGVALRLMARVIAEPVDDRAPETVRIELRAEPDGDRVRLEIGGRGVPGLRAHFARRDIRSMGSA